MSVSCSRSVLPDLPRGCPSATGGKPYAIKARVALFGLGARHVAQSIVFALDLIVVAGVQGCSSISQLTAPNGAQWPPVGSAAYLGRPVWSWESTLSQRFLRHGGGWVSVTVSKTSSQCDATAIVARRSSSSSAEAKEPSRVEKLGVVGDGSCSIWSLGLGIRVDPDRVVL